MKRNQKRILIIFLLFLAILITLASWATLDYLSEEPPLIELNACRDQIELARSREAEKYAASTLNLANTLYEQAVNEWGQQNQKLFFLRDFQSMRQLIRQADSLALQAIELTSQRRGSLQKDLDTGLKKVDMKIAHFQENYAFLPLAKKTLQNFTKAKLMFLEAQSAFQRGAYKEVDSNLENASHLISKSVTEAHEMLRDYFSELKNWQKWRDETLDWSRKSKQPAIIVDKFAHSCQVYHSGKLKATFMAELGPNWIGDKQFRGDKATPEGKYYITRKKSGHDTKYYKALLINYPNDEDKERYQKNIKNGNIPRRGIGNLIEIHGDGGKGINWTDGCVALTNENMDKLFDLVKTGTPVTIVGSLRSLEEINGK